MENIEDLPEEVFDLLSAKKYEEFSTNELKLLGQYIPPKEIKEYSCLVQDFLSLDSAQEKELNREELPLKTITKEIPITKNILTRQIPLYQAVAAAVVVFVATIVAFSMFGNQNKPIANEEGNKKENSVQFINNQETKILSVDSTLLNKPKGKSLLEEDYPEELVFTL